VRIGDVCTDEGRDVTPVAETAVRMQ
jgi:hypothetical protein